MNPKLKKILIALAILIGLVLLYRYYMRRRCTCADQIQPVSSGGGGGALTQNAIQKIIDNPPVNPRTGVVKVVNGGGGGINYLGDDGAEIVSGSGFGISGQNTIHE